MVSRRCGSVLLCPFVVRRAATLFRSIVTVVGKYKYKYAFSSASGHEDALNLGVLDRTAAIVTFSPQTRRSRCGIS